MNDERLREILEEARALGFLGPTPVGAHVRHSRRMAAASPIRPERFLDLGAGGGIPGLVLALCWPAAQAVLLDSNGRRASFLTRAVQDLGLGQRIAVRRARAELAGREADLRGSFDLVAARSFARPGVTAECAAAFVRAGGVVVVSEPPARSESEEGTAGGATVEAQSSASVRWPADGLAALGMRAGRVVRDDDGTFQILEQAAACPARFPRRAPAKRPLF